MKQYFIFGLIVLLFSNIVLAQTLDTPMINPDSTANLTDEQMKYIQDIQAQKKHINSSEIRFLSGYTVSKPHGIEQNIPQNIAYYVIQFYSPLADVDVAARDKIEEAGIVLLEYIQDNAFYAKVPQSAFSTITSLIADEKIRYLGTVPYDAKISQQIIEDVQTNPDSDYNIVVHLFEKPTKDQLRTFGEYMRIDSYSDVTYFVYGTAKGSEIAKIPNQDFVKLIEKENPVSISSIKNNQFIVIFREWSAPNKEQVLSVEGVQYVKDTTYGDQGIPAIIISAEQPSLDKIREFNFVSNVQPVISAIDPMPKVTTVDNSSILLVIAILVVVVIALFIKKFRA